MTVDLVVQVGQYVGGGLHAAGGHAVRGHVCKGSQW